MTVCAYACAVLCVSVCVCVGSFELYILLETLLVYLALSYSINFLRHLQWHHSKILTIPVPRSPSLVVLVAQSAQWNPQWLAPR